MRWIWKNAIVLLNYGAGLIGLGFVFALFALVGFRSIFYALSVGSTTVGVLSILCALIIFCLQFGVRSAPKKVIACAFAVQVIMSISYFTFYKSINFYSRLYSLWIGIILGGLGFVMMEMAVLLLVIGLIRLFFYTPRQS